MPNRSQNIVAAPAQPSPGIVDDRLATAPTVGVLGARWRATVTPWGAVRPWDGLPTLDWHVAADDRWHTPASEPAIRQSRLDGTAVVETRLRVPQGDAVQRVFAVADHGGMTLIEIENDSSLPIAVAFSGSRVVSARPPARVPIEGIALPDDTVVFPIGHRASITVALPHDGRLADLPGRLPTAAQVARGWSATCDRASRLELPDAGLVESVVAARCELLLGGPPAPADDPVEFLLSVHQLVRMIDGAPAWMPDVAEAVAALARRAPGDSAELDAALDAATAVAEAAGDRRARRDLDKLRARVLPNRPPCSRLLDAPDRVGARGVAQIERGLATAGDLLPAGLPPSWWGQNFEVHGVPTTGTASISFAVRWHGDRPAVLWQCSGPPAHLTSSVLAPGWSSDQASGEALWPAPTRSIGGRSRRRAGVVQLMCDCLVALPPATDSGSTLFAKNSDRPPDETQHVAWWPGRRDAAPLRATHITIEAWPAETIGCLLSTPTWCWGAEHGVNEAGVAIGNEAIYTTLDPRSAAPALIGMDLVRLGLERAESATAAIDVMVSLLEQYGQGGTGHDPGGVGGAKPYWSSFLVADPSSAYVLETSGRTWAVEEVVTARAISNRTTIEAFDAEHRHPGQPVAELVDPRLAASRRTLDSRPVTVAALAAHLRSHDSCASPGWSVCMHATDGGRVVETTTSSMIAELRPDGAHRAWVVLGSPCSHEYVEVSVGQAISLTA